MAVISSLKPQAVSYAYVDPPRRPPALRRGPADPLAAGGRNPNDRGRYTQSKLVFDQRRKIAGCVGPVAGTGATEREHGLNHMVACIAERAVITRPIYPARIRLQREVVR